MDRSRTPARVWFLVAAVSFASACSLEHWPREPFSSEVLDVRFGADGRVREAFVRGT